MSRHLMAKMRKSAAGGPPKVDWRHGWVLPHRAAEIEHFNSEHDVGDNPITAAEYSTGIVHHGEQRYAIEVSASSDGDLWNWSIHKQVGPNANNPEHWKHMGGIPTMGCFCGWGDNDWPEGGTDHRFFGFEYPDEDDEDEAGGYPTGRENAMIAGEDAFQEHIASQRHSPADYDRMVGDLDEPEGGYDIFGDKP